MPPPELGEGFVRHEGVYVAADAGVSPYQRQWENEAEQDHVFAAIAREAPEETLEQLTAKLTGVWDRIPAGSRYGTILDIGSGYGRVALHLSSRGVGCSTYVAVDISSSMLRHLLRYRERFEIFPDAEVLPLCVSAETLPLEDASVDVALSSAVFLHMGRSYVAATLAEIARVLRPGGIVVFETSFPNRLCPANAPSLLSGLRPGRRPNQVKYYSLAEVAALVEETGLAGRIGAYRIEATGRALLPKAVAGRRVPLARRINAFVDGRAIGPERLLGLTFTVTNLPASQT